jgi:hypothetical protein
MSKFVEIGGRTVLVSRRDGCSTDVGLPVCAEPVVTFVVAPMAESARQANPGMRDALVIVPKCEKHLAELPRRAGEQRIDVARV